MKKKTLPIVPLASSVFLMAAAAFAAEPTTSANKAQQLPDVTVSGEHASSEGPVLKEEELVGPNEQPEWTRHRRFATTRIYVLEPWQVEFEQWWRGKFPKHDGDDSHRFQSEIGLGLPYRFQIDYYANVEHESSTTRFTGHQVELRYALAEWGKIPLNPTLYGEWKFNRHAPDAYEVKLLLGDELAPGWHYGINLFYEQEVGGGRESELGASAAISRTLIDEVLSAGVEMKFERASGPNLDGLPAVEFLVGPSIQWRPVRRVHLDFVPLFGTTYDSPAVEAYIVFGIDFGRVSGDHHDVLAPTSVRSQ